MQALGHTLTPEETPGGGLTMVLGMRISTAPIGEATPADTTTSPGIAPTAEPDAVSVPDGRRQGRR
jgi:hypothetical protein